MKREWWAAGAAFLLLASACAPPKQTSTNHNVAAVESPSPSPSPKPTTAFAASSPGFHGGEVGIGYAPVALTATGGVHPYHWSVSTGALPPGVTLGGDGTLTGTPTAAGTFTFAIQASDSGDGTASIPGTIKVAPRLTAALLPACAQSCNVELGCANACGAYGTFTGGVPPYGFTLVQGPLPFGTTLSPNSLSLNGTFGGQTGYLQFTVQVGDAFGATARVSPTFWMYPHVAVAGNVCYGNYNTGCTVRLPISGGVPNARYSVRLVANGPNTAQGCWNSQQATPPPPNSLAVNGNSVVITIPKGIGNGYGGIWTLVVTDDSICAPSTYCASSQATVSIGVQCG